MKCYRLSLVAFAALLSACGIVLAQDSVAGTSPAGPTRRPAARPLVFVEQGPTVEATLFDGSPISLETQTVSRFISGTDETNLTAEDLRNIVISGREAFAADPNIIAITGESGGPRDGGPRTPLEIVFNASSPPAGAQAALDAAAAYIESVFTDPVTVTINVSWANLGGSILGSTSSSYAGAAAWSTVRSGLIADMDTNDSIQNWLPSGSTIPVRYDGTSGTVTNETVVYFTIANYNAAIGTMAGVSAYMQFNNAFSWDYDPSNGITSGTTCFQSVVVHEVGHVLGFTSGADFRDYDMEALDIFRFQRTDGTGDYNPDTEAEFQTTARLVALYYPDDDHNSDLISVEYRMSDGSPYQASHFRQGSVDGIMQPAISSGTTFYPNFYRTADIAMFDAIGWDYSPEPGTTTLPFFDNFPTTTLDTSLWTGIEGAASNDVGTSEPSAPYSLNLDGSAGGGDKIRTAVIDTSPLSDIQIEYYYERRGGGNSPESGDDLVVEYRNSTGSWIELARYLGSGTDMSTYAFAAHNLTAADAFHPGFRVQFRAISSEVGLDDWFVDDVHLYTNTDLVPPTPNPMTYNVDPDGSPDAISTNSVTMTATEATDPSGGIQYHFAGSGVGVHSSSWQSSRTYTDSGLQVNRPYSYTVTARDAALNETTGATESTATWIETPTGLSFGTITDTSVVVNALGTFTRLDQNLSGLYFEVTTLDGTPVGSGTGVNGWTASSLSQTATVAGLSPGTTYRFRVKARNYYGLDETPWYPTAGYVEQATTGGVTCSLLGDINQDGLVNGVDVDGFVRAKLGGAPLPGENQVCADYGGTLEQDVADFVADLLGL